ncbi:MAG: large-conductance mechanosensitive channel protein MscL [Imperialibacter sp.]|uniref:large-conductance mechanosensitive channel protein MscL n=1 Tax=Imperialibacter sp. TaxID=2038411 RepID=UPI003A863237
MGILKEFKDFALKGNVIDLATAVIIGGAFGKVVSSLVNDILMPPIGVLLGNVNFRDLSVVIQEAVGEKAAVTINYGAFTQTMIDFIIIAFSIFMVIKAYKRMEKKKEEAPAPAAPPAPSNEEKLLTEIRDLLKAQK